MQTLMGRLFFSAGDWVICQNSVKDHCKKYGEMQHFYVIIYHPGNLILIIKLV